MHRDAPRVTSPTATSHAVSRYLGGSAAERDGIALCLSGGGYRATLFDLGAMRRLDELGMLSRVKTFTSVSGGSIAAAFLAAHLVDRLHGTWPAPGERIPGFEEGVAQPLKRLAGTNIRTEAALSRLNPLNLRKPNAASDKLESSYARWITSSPIAAMPSSPGFVFCGTDLTFRCGWTVDSARQLIGNDISGFFRPVDRNWTIARAVAASSCFPGVFPPMQVDVRDAVASGGRPDGSQRGEIVTSIDVTDGGVFDNLGLEPVWQDHAIILVSDATPSFGPSPDLGPVWPSIRPIVALLEQATLVRKRWLIANFLKQELAGAYWGLASRPSNYEPAGDVVAYPDDLIERIISQVRIELDAFSDAEQRVLENHGYLMCDLAIQKHLPALLDKPGAPLAPPHPEWMDPARVERALASSHRYRILGRGEWR
ncbi:MAG: patatin-like phospholipase family protein [Thermomicrobiales bacterium]